MRFTIDIQTEFTGGPSGLEFRRLLDSIILSSYNMSSNACGGPIKWDGRDEKWSLMREVSDHPSDDWTLTIYKDRPVNRDGL